MTLARAGLDQIDLNGSLLEGRILEFANGMVFFLPPGLFVMVPAFPPQLGKEP